MTAQSSVSHAGTTRAKRVVVIGQGYVGLPLAMAAVRSGYRVIGYDSDRDRANLLKSGVSPTPDVPAAQLKAALTSRRYTVSTRAQACRDFDVAVVAVPTPLSQHAPDLHYTTEAARTLARYVRPGATVVVESSTYPGTTEDVLQPILESGSGLKAEVDFYLGYSPERIDPGHPEHSFQNTPKLVAGVGERSLGHVKEFYDTLVHQTVPVSGTRAAELTKLLENTFRAVNIALVNETAMIAAELGLDVWEAIDAAATKPFGFMPFYPGPGVGGHCLPVDPRYLSWYVMQRLGVGFRFVQLATDVNTHMPNYVAQRVVTALNGRYQSVNGATILLLGLAYKANTADLRESPAVEIAQHLLRFGATVSAVDTRINQGSTDGLDSRIKLVPLTESALRRADLVVLLTDHDDVDYAMVVANAKAVLDTRHRLTGERVEYL